jgi:hypothetical protein
MTNSTEKINRRFKLLNTSFDALKTYFDKEVPNSINFEFHFFNMISNYSSLLNNIMAVLDFKDNTHPNLNKEKRTGFHVYDLKKNTLPQSKYNTTQIAFLESVKELFITQCSFNKKDIKNWLGLDEEKNKDIDLVYNELKKSKSFKEINQSLNGQKKMDEDFKIQFRNQRLSVYKEKIENGIAELLKIEEETTLETFRKIRNEEEHFSLTEKNIINRHCFKIGRSRDSLILIKKDSSASFENCSFALDFNGATELAGMKICDLGKNSLIINGFMSFDKILLTNKKMGWKSNLITVNNDLISKNSFYISKPSFDSFVIDKETKNLELKNCSFIIGDEVYENISLLYKNNKFTDISNNDFFENYVTENIVTTHTITLDKSNIEINAKELAEQLFYYSKKLYELYLKIENKT